ncbi:hypothetical protein RJ641_035277 [Dillenia turbinata]|uniref:Uncharacterized protein n=1 Tax=Dillenia turbinata TaxID=194707 RepID=A0AAN8VSW0_9MAGN
MDLCQLSYLSIYLEWVRRRCNIGLAKTHLAIIPGTVANVIFAEKEYLTMELWLLRGQPDTIGLVNHCIPAGEAHLKALEIA